MRASLPPMHGTPLQEDECVLRLLKDVENGVKDSHFELSSQDKVSPLPPLSV